MSEPRRGCPLCGKMHGKAYDVSEDEGYAITNKFRITDAKKEGGKWLVRSDKAFRDTLANIDSQNKNDLLRRNMVVDVVIFTMRVHLALQGFKNVDHREEVTIFNYLFNLYQYSYKKTGGFKVN